MNWKSRGTNKVLSKTVGKFTIVGTVTHCADRVAAAVFVEGDDAVESRQQTFWGILEAMTWTELVVDELAKEASWSSL